MAEVEMVVRLDGNTRAMVVADGPDGVPHLVVTTDEVQVMFTLAELLIRRVDVNLRAIAAATVFAREANEWLRQLGQIVQGNDAMGERFPQS